MTLSTELLPSVQWSHICSTRLASESWYVWFEAYIFVSWTLGCLLVKFKQKIISWVFQISKAASIAQKWLKANVRFPCLDTNILWFVCMALLSFWVMAFPCFLSINGHSRLQYSSTPTVHHGSTPTIQPYTPTIQPHIYHTPPHLPHPPHSPTPTTPPTHSHTYHIVLHLPHTPTPTTHSHTYHLCACSSFPSVISSSHFLTVSGTLKMCLRFSTAAPSCDR